MNGEEIRTTEPGDRISAELLREYQNSTLGHDAVRDLADELVFDHVVGGGFYPAYGAALLKVLVTSTIEAATTDDWKAVFDTLVSEAREAMPELETETSDSSRLEWLKPALRAVRSRLAERITSRGRA